MVLCLYSQISNAQLIVLSKKGQKLLPGDRLNLWHISLKFGSCTINCCLLPLTVKWKNSCYPLEYLEESNKIAQGTKSKLIWQKAVLMRDMRLWALYSFETLTWPPLTSPYVAMPKATHFHHNFYDISMAEWKKAALWLWNGRNISKGIIS